MRVVSYNSRGLRLGQGAGDRAHRVVIDKLLESAEILCLQETFLATQDLDKLNSVHNDFHGAGESTTDLSNRILRGRIPGGVAILWHKKLDPLVSVIRLEVDWCIGIKVVHNKNVFIILNIYTPYECHKNEDEYLNRLSFISSYIKESAYTCIYVLGDWNADIPDSNSLFGQHLTQVCKDEKLILSSKVLLPDDSYTYISEAWHTTSWLDHCISTADAHDSIVNMEILHGMTTADHLPFSVTINVNGLPELASFDVPQQCHKLDWANLTENELQQYKTLTDIHLNNIDLPVDAITCRNINCNDGGHSNDLSNMYDIIVNCLIMGSNPLKRKKSKQDNMKPGWNVYVKEKHVEAKDAFKCWVAAGKPRHGPECERKKLTNSRYKYALRYIKRNEHAMRANSMAEKLQKNNVDGFWKEVKVLNNSKMPMPSSIDGTTGPDNIAELWRRHYENIFNCVKSDVFNLGEITSNDGVTVRYDEVKYAIEKLVLNKACGRDLITAEHLKHSSHRVSVLLALCFSGLLMHGILPESMLSVLLVPVVKNKTGKITSIDNYRPIALASIMSKIFEGILMDRLKEFTVTTDNQFGFKKKHGTDLCIYTLKEIVSQYRSHNSTIFMCFLDASRAFDRIHHGKLFLKLQERGVPSYLIRILQFWYSHQTMRARWGTSTSTPFLVSNGVRQGGILSPLLFNLYMDDLSKQLNECKTGCMVGDNLINHMIYADDLAVLSPYSAGLQQLLRICTKYGFLFDIMFNSKKSVVMICKTKDDQKLTFPSFSLAGEVLEVVKKFKYLGHIIRDDLCDDDDVQRQCCKLYGQANMLARKFHMCTDNVKIALFKTYCTPLYTAHLWCRYTSAKMKKLQVAYNDAFRIFLKLPRWTSASEMFVTSNVSTFHAVLRNFMFKFMCRLKESNNVLSMALTGITQSDTRFSSCLWNHWRKCLYVF